MKKSNEFSHFILTRYNNGIYDKLKNPDKWMYDRYQLFQATRDSVLSQEGDFRWIISMDKRTPESYIKKISTDKRIYITNKDIREFFDKYKFKTDWVITTRMDNDDILLNGAIKKIQERFRPQLTIIDIDYWQLDMSTGMKYTSGNRSKHETYRMGPNSPFLSLVEPASYVKTCYCRPHNKLLDGYPGPDGKQKIRGEKIREQLAIMVVHGDNIANKITGYPA